MGCASVKGTVIWEDGKLCVHVPARELYYHFHHLVDEGRQVDADHAGEPDGDAHERQVPVDRQTRRLLLAIC